MDIREAMDLMKLEPKLFVRCNDNTSIYYIESRMFYGYVLCKFEIDDRDIKNWESFPTHIDIWENPTMYFDEVNSYDWEVFDFLAFKAEPKPSN